MNRVDLVIEHRFQNRFIRRRVLRAKSRRTTFGSSRDADIRLLGNDVNGIHAALEFRENQWVLFDLGSFSGTVIKDDRIIEYPVTEDTAATLGSHQIIFRPTVIDSELFLPSKTERQGFKGPGTIKDPVKRENKSDSPHKDLPQTQVCHQIIVRRKEQILRTVLLNATESFSLKSEEKVIVLAPPQSYDWQILEIGKIHVQHRLIEIERDENLSKIVFSRLIDKDFRIPFTSALTCLVLLFGILAIFGNFDPTHLKPDDNRFTQMIYDAKVTRNIKKQASEISDKIKKASASAVVTNSPSSKTPAAATPTPTPEASRVAKKTITQIKAFGLSQLIGRISKRAATQAPKLYVGVDHSAKTKPVTTGVLGTVSEMAPSASSGSSVHISGVVTAGKGGGQGHYKSLGGMNVGGVGQGEVGVEEEDVDISGGLDREVIANYIKDQLGHIRYCYERQLSANPELFGKIQVRFTIGPSGSVAEQKIGENSLKNAMVEGCILRRVASWAFPAPKGGMSVMVTYPFLFRSIN